MAGVGKVTAVLNILFSLSVLVLSDTSFAGLFSSFLLPSFLSCLFSFFPPFFVVLFSCCLVFFFSFFPPFFVVLLSCFLVVLFSFFPLFCCLVVLLSCCLVFLFCCCLCFLVVVVFLCSCFLVLCCPASCLVRFLSCLFSFFFSFLVIFFFWLLFSGMSCLVLFSSSRLFVLSFFFVVDPINHVEYVNARSADLPFGLVPNWYKIFPTDHVDPRGVIQREQCFDAPLSSCIFVPSDE